MRSTGNADGPVSRAMRLPWIAAVVAFDALRGDLRAPPPLRFFGVPSSATVANRRMSVRGGLCDARKLATSSSLAMTGSEVDSAETGSASFGFLLGDAVQHVGGLHGAVVVGDDDELRCVGELAQ